MVTPAVFDRRLVFVTGKGGVGKTSLAAALALSAARRGRSVLVCEMDAKGSLASAFDAAPLGYAARQLEPGLSAMAMDTEDSLKEYLRLFVRVPLIGSIGPLARTFDFVADAAPGVKEILAIGKLCHEVRQRSYDLVVVDAEASGHIVAQIGAPTVIRELVKVGLVRDQTDWMLDLLHDPEVTGVVVVTTPEELPVAEAIGLTQRLVDETGVAVGQFVVNRMPTDPLGDVGERLLTALDGGDRGLIGALLAELGGSAAGRVVESARSAAARRRVAAGHVARLVAAADVPIATVPELSTRATGRRVVELIADSIDADRAGSPERRV